MGLLVPERLSAYRELCYVELQRTVNIALSTTAPVFVSSRRVLTGFHKTWCERRVVGMISYIQ